MTITGATGSGKTQAALFHLSLQDFMVRPWIIYNFKNEKLIDNIPYVYPMDLDQMPDKPGVYVVHPMPGQDADVERHMLEIWQREKHGLFIDEGYMIDRNSHAYSMLLTQGRSKEIPIITLSQRPVWLNRFVFSETNFYQVFRLQGLMDRKKMMEYVPANLETLLPEFHSYYYDVGINKLTKLAPVPDLATIYATFARKLHTRRDTI